MPERWARVLFRNCQLSVYTIVCNSGVLSTLTSFDLAISWEADASLLPACLLGGCVQAHYRFERGFHDSSGPYLAGAGI
eukprot:4317465-Amphidinium_carterae.1